MQKKKGEKVKEDQRAVNVIIIVQEERKTQGRGTKESSWMSEGRLRILKWCENPNLVEIEMQVSGQGCGSHQGIGHRQGAFGVSNSI